MPSSDARRSYVLRVGEPPTRREQLQVAAALLQGAAVVIVPHRCVTAAEWLGRYAPEQAH
jgi:hypothetical protein